MTKTTRRLAGWPPGTAQDRPSNELARAKQNDAARAEAATVLLELLDDDKAGRVNVDTAAGDVLLHLPVKTRWALHLAVGVLRGRKADADADGEES